MTTRGHGVASNALYKLCFDDPNGAVELLTSLKGSPAELKAQIGFRTDKGVTPLYAASENGHHRLVEALLEAGAGKDAANNNSWASLSVASENGHARTVEILLAAGAHKDVPTEYGITPLYVASEKGHHLVVEMLLAAGADKSKQFFGDSPLSIARSRGHSKVVALLSSPTRPALSPFLAASLTNLNRVKLMVVGRAAVGKTTLVRALFGKQLDASIPSTDGIDLGQFSAGGIDFMTWDFGGQRVYRYTHQLFLSSHAVYLVLFKASESVAESLKELRFWMNSISARISDSMVLLVGTHADKVDAKEAQCHGAAVSHAIAQEYPSLFQIRQRVHVISAFAASTPAFKGLLEAIVQAGQSASFPAPENHINALTYLLALNLSPPVIELRTAIESLQAIPSGCQSKPQTLRLLKAFHGLGLISVFQNEELPSRGLIVLRPQWIAKLLATIVTTTHSFVNEDSGMLTHAALVNQLWTDHAEFPPERHSELIDLLVQLDILFPVRQSEEERGYFVPCMLREEAPDVGFYLPGQLREAALQLHRVMELECAVPISVIPPIMVELMGRGEMRARWQQGCVVRIPPSRPGMQDQVWLQVWRSEGRQIELKVWGESIRTVTHWLRRVCSRIESRLTDYYHIKHRTLLPCRDCSSSLGGHFIFDDLRDQVLRSCTESSCQPNKLHCCRLDTMVPDLLFLDLCNPGFIVPSESLLEICELGQGAVGKVLKMSMTVSVAVDDRSGNNHRTTASNNPTCSSRPMPHDRSEAATPSAPAVKTTVVAVKFLGKVNEREDEPCGNIFEEFQHEVYLMISLDDPNVVKLEGICLQPKLAMVMELVEGGNLYDQLNDPFRLESQVYGLVKCVNEEFSNRQLKMSFRHVFLNRDKLAADDREQLEARIVGLLTCQQLDDVIGWVQGQFDQNSRTLEFIRLTNANPVTDLGLAIEQLETLGISKPPLLETLGNGALEKARRAFREWKENAGIRGTSGLIEAIESGERHFFECVEELYEMWAHQASSRDFQRMEQRLNVIKDGLGQLSKEQALVVAPVDEPLRLKLAIDIARGMLHLHELNPPIVHRDFKSPNVFLTRPLINLPPLQNGEDEGQSWSAPLAKVGDFGLSLLSLQSQSFQTRDSVLHLNPTWAAPELMSGGRFSTPVDVYAMGIVLWELLFRQHPFLEIPIHKLAGEVMAGLRPFVPPAVTEDPDLREYVAVMRRCWHQNPSMRPSMREVYLSLRDICKIRCPMLSAKLPPPPAAKSSVSWQEHGLHETTAPIITSHSFTIPAGSAPQPSAAAGVPRVSCMLAPLKQREVLWLGLASGHVALVDYQHGGPQRERIPWIQCCFWDKHIQRVTAISHLCRNSQEEGTVWTGAEDGSIHVWSPRLRSLEEIYDANTLKGRLEYHSRLLFIKKATGCWVECENGALTWYEKRYDLKPIYSLHVTSIRSVAMADSQSLSIVESSGKTHEFRELKNDHRACGLTEWHRVLNNILSAQASNAHGISRLAGLRQTQQAILALEAMDHTIWSANSGFVLTELRLDNTVDHHGLHRTMQLRPLRCVKLDVSKLEPARLRVIGGLVRVAASVLWVAVGNRWVVLDATAGVATWQGAMVEGMEKVAAVLPVRSEEGGRKGQEEVWTVDYQGRRIVWRCDDPRNPSAAGELVDEMWGAEDGRGYCMVQVGGRQVWMGTSQGRVLSWDIFNRHLVPQPLQPLPASHPLGLTRSVCALVSIPGAQSPIVWCAVRNKTLIRFSW